VWSHGSRASEHYAEATGLVADHDQRSGAPLRSVLSVGDVADHDEHLLVGSILNPLERVAHIPGAAGGDVEYPTQRSPLVGHEGTKPCNGSQFTSRDFHRHVSARRVTHRRGGYRDPESQAFIESWFGQFKKRCA